ncbi:MAG: DUF1622 domain-containing protein [Acidimicrobiia bacterium]|nr:DUF1622 domain-containing protein [Acidimicrobiia bacterium]
MDNIAKGFEAVGVAVIVIGGIFALLHGLKHFRHINVFFGDVRREFGRPLLLGLEVLVAADIIKTITVDPSLESVGVLAILVAVRIALSFSLEIEVDGMLPWRRAQLGLVLQADESAPEDEEH